MTETRTPLAPLTLEGWYVLHQFFQVARPPASGEEGGERRTRAEALGRLLADWEDLGDDGWSGLYRVVGGGGTDYMLVHFRSTLDALGEAERELRRNPGGGDLFLTGDYLSVVELGLYALTAALAEKAEAEDVEVHSEEWSRMVDEALRDQQGSKYVQGRLYPRQPENMPYACFYPMDKRRNPGQNWYTLDVAERADLMHDHGRTGRRYAGKISQVITGSVGFDDWEWAVTLFAEDPLSFKSLVTEMRYDEVSSVYAEFGSFWVGHRIPAAGIPEEIGG
jgi:chlorite dismutase